MARRATKTQKKSGSLWRKILLATFLLALAVIGSAAYVLFSPVTPQNVNSRLAGICTFAGADR